MSENTNLEVRDIEKRELNNTINSYVGNKHELLEKVPELIDWDMFQKRCVPELVQVLQMQYKRLQKKGVTIRTKEKELFKHDSLGERYVAQTENRWYDGSDCTIVLLKRAKRIREYCREKSEIARFKDKGWFTYFFRKVPGEGRKISSEDIEFSRLRSYGRESEYRLEQNFRQERANLWTLLIVFWFLISLVSCIPYLLIFGTVSDLFTTFSQEKIYAVSLIGTACFDVVLRLRLIRIYLRYRRRLKSGKYLKSIRQQYPDFCMERFATMAGNRLKMLFYADSMADVGDFVSCDLSTFLQIYANVLDCETLDFWFGKISQDDNYEYIEVRQKVLLTGDFGDIVKRKKLIVKLRFMRSKDSIMYTDFYRDWYIGELAAGGKLWR